jgi:hypothetical protein
MLSMLAPHGPICLVSNLSSAIANYSIVSVLKNQRKYSCLVIHLEQKRVILVCIKIINFEPSNSKDFLGPILVFFGKRIS